MIAFILILGFTCILFELDSIKSIMKEWKTTQDS